MSNKSRKIIRLQAENVKRLKAVDISPGDGSTVVIGGNNGAGKSSVLDAIMYALAGGRSICEKPIRDGETSAQVVCELEDMIIKRTWTESGTKLRVESRKGARYSSPQSMLDELTGSLTFDPLVFASQSDTEQIATLKALAGVDFDALNADRSEIYDERRVVGREVKTLEGQRQGIELHEDAPDEPVKVSDVTDRMEAARQHNAAIDQKTEEVDDIAGSIGGIDHRLGEIEQKIKELRQEARERMSEKSELTKKKDALEEELSTLERQPIEPIREELEGIEEVNAKVRQNKEAAELDEKIASKRAQYDELTAQLDRLDAEKRDKIAAANLPIDELSFDESGVTYQGVPLAQASAAERLRVSVAMGLALNPDLRVMLVRDGSLLDSSNLQMIADMAAEHDAQVWIERVGDGAEVSIVIEDGEISEIRDAAE